ncbi:MAG: hypothetical protein KAS90_01565 [Candidatus Aenigmarchaeota archaeon]|nr:hypothetical protein [Candidatus Aenigmarchaeota archaeon]
MGIRDVFDKSYSVLRNNFKESLLIGVVFWIIAIVVEGSFFLSGMISLDDLYGSGSIQVSVMNLIMASMFAMLSGGVYYAISRMKRSKVDISDIRKGIEVHWHNIIKAFVLLQVIVFFISQVLNLFMDNYITASTPAYLLLSIVLISAVILMQASLMFTLPIVVIEKMDGFRAVKRSIEFFRDNASFVLGSMILMFFIVFAISFTFMSVAVAAVYIMDMSVYLGVPIVVALSMAFVFLIVLAYPCLSIFLVTLYKTGKRKK